ncbi:MAG: YggT family protein [Candidatus Dojkabacteria bacterium]|jgi:uncharacterized protein YggT (Ycf19 family)
MISLIFKILRALTIFLQTSIILRILLKVIDANVENKLVSWIYNFTDAVMTPFSGIVEQEILIDRFRLELTPIVTLLFLSILAFALSELSKSFQQAD